MKAVDIPHMQPHECSNDDALTAFVTAQNIKLYKAQLAAEPRPDKRDTLLELLANELAKLPKSGKALR